jgi:hypothetical protein
MQVALTKRKHHPKLIARPLVSSSHLFHPIFARKKQKLTEHTRDITSGEGQD